MGRRHPRSSALPEALIKSSTVKVSNRANPLDEYLTMSEAAQELKVNYHTLREWVVIKKMIPFFRLGNSPKGDVRILRSHLREFAEGKTSTSPAEAGKSPS